MNLIALKMVLMVAILLIHLVGMIPSINCGGRCCKSKEPLLFMNCFAAGIFFSMAAFHMLPESFTLYNDWVKAKHVHHAFPLPAIIFMCGYLTLLGFEKFVIDKIIEKQKDKQVAEHQTTNDDELELQ